MPGQRHSTSPFSSTSSTTSERSKPEDPSSYKCSCGTGDGSGDYIQCDNDDCKLSWYHWECVQVTEAPAGTWLCPSCSPSASFYIKQLVTKRAASPVVPKVEMRDEAAGSKTRKQKQKPVLETKEKDVAKKGVAVKKRGEETPKPKWKGWMELSSDGEQDFKKKVDAQWDVEDDLVGKRRRGSRAIIQEAELSPRALRARSRPEQQINKRARDEDEHEHEHEGESLYQENPQDTPIRRSTSPTHVSSNDPEDSDEAPIRRRAPVTYISTDDSNDSEDTMDVDQEPMTVEISSSDELSAQLASELNNAKTASQPSTEDTDDTTDMEYEDAMEYQDEPPKSNSESISTPTHTPHSIETIASSQSPPPESSSSATAHQDATDVQADDALATINPLLDHTSLYTPQTNRWVSFPESALRSTLPRLG